MSIRTCKSCGQQFIAEHHCPAERRESADVDRSLELASDALGMHFSRYCEDREKEEAIRAARARGEGGAKG